MESSMFAKYASLINSHKNNVQVFVDDVFSISGVSLDVKVVHITDSKEVSLNISSVERMYFRKIDLKNKLESKGYKVKGL